MYQFISQILREIQLQKFSLFVLKSISRVLLYYVFNYLALLRASLIFLYFFEELFAPVYHIFS